MIVKTSKSTRIRISTERLILRLPDFRDFAAWRDIREASRDFLTPWEPVWAEDALSRRAYTNRVIWANRSASNDTALPLFLFDRAEERLVGGLSLNNILRGPSQSATIGYWIGKPYARQGYMREAINAVTHFAFTRLDLSRIQAGCLKENIPSRSLLESCGYKYEGVAQAYLQINGRWQNHVLYANLRADRRGRTNAGA